MKLQKIFFIVLFISFISVGIAGAWGLPKGLGGAPSSSGDIDSFLAKAQDSETLVNKSTESLYKAVANKEDQAKIELMQKTMKETTDPKEKNKIQREISESEMAIVEKQAADKGLQEEAAKWDDKKKENVGNAFYNFALGALQAGLLVPEGNNIMSSVKSNPANAVKLATKLDVAMDSVKTLGGIANGSVKTISALKSLMSAAKISVTLPTSINEKPKQIEGGI
jgi:hypothetical protein